MIFITLSHSTLLTSLQPEIYNLVAPFLTPSWVRPIYQTFATVRAFGLPFIDRLVEKPDIASVAILLFTLWISLKILGMAYRAVMFWVTLAIRFVFWASLIFVGVWVWNRGPDGVIEDVSHWWGVYMGEVKYWEEQQELRQQMGQRDYQRYGGGNRYGARGW